MKAFTAVIIAADLRLALIATGPHIEDGVARYRVECLDEDPRGGIELEADDSLLAGAGTRAFIVRRCGSIIHLEDPTARWGIDDLGVLAGGRLLADGIATDGAGRAIVVVSTA